VGFSVKDRRVGFPRSYLEQAPGGAILKIDSDGILHIKPPGRIPRQVATSTSNSDGDPFVRTDDKVEISGDRVIFLGRASGLINVGGLKVLPEEVEIVLLSHPSVAYASVRGKRNSISGQLVEADVGLRAGVAPNGVVAELRAFCSQRLPPYKVPALIRVVSVMGPLTAAGKQERTRPL
jgi:acyl-CoA synthetase (AMP-forming)/AMP-acid ligase II